MDRKAPREREIELRTKAEARIADLQMYGSLNAGKIGIADCAPPDCAQPAAPRELETPRAIARLGALVQTLQEKITDLNLRLGPVMSFESDALTKDAIAPSPESEIARRIEALATEVLIAKNRLEEILERLEI